MKKKTNWWVILAILIIGIPVGYVATGVIKKMAEKKTLPPDDTIIVPDVDSTENNIMVFDSIREQKPVEPNSEKKTKNADEVSNNSNPNKQDIDEMTHQRKSQISQKTDEQIRKDAEYAEKQKKLKEEQQRQKEERDEKLRLQREEQERIKKEKEEEVRIEKERKAEEARQKKAEEDRKKAELAEQKKREAEETAERKKKEAEAEAEKKKNELKNEVQKIVASGQKSVKVPDGCAIVVNGRNTTDYQAFRMGVNYKSYSNVIVNSVTTDLNGNVTSIAVTATESKEVE